MQFLESDFLKLVQARSRKGGGAGIVVGVGDDGAVLDPAGRQVVVVTDMTLDGVDFRLEQCGYRAAGRKAMARNLSDLAAMAAEPWCCFISVALPAGVSGADCEELLAGLYGQAEAFDCEVAGGDTKRSPGSLLINVAMAGYVTEAGPVLRGGARPGDLLFVTGRLGGSGLGRHLDFTPRVAEALRLNERHGPTAMIDLSDGLAVDLTRLCEASGIGARLFGDALPLHAAAEQAASRDGRSAVLHALLDGEDYELLFSLDPKGAERLGADPDLGPLVTCVGVCRPGPDGLRLVTRAGESELPAGGFEHRFSTDADT